MADQTIIRADDVVITGNLEVTGSQISTTTTNTTIKDRLITLNKGGTIGTNTAGIEIESGGSIEATIGYTAAAGWNFGNKNITTSGTISGTISLAANSVDETMIDFGTGANQVSTADIPEQTNLYYTDARADARISNAVLSALSNVHTAAPTDGQVLAWDNGNSRWAPADRGHTSTDTLTEGSSNLYYTNARARASISLGSAGAQAYNNSTGVLTVPGTTDHITEGSNQFYTNARADARIAAASINALSDVNTSGIADGQVLMYNGSNFVAQSPAMGVTEVVKSGTTTSGVMTVTAQSFDTSSSTATRVGGSVTLTLQQNAFAFISYSANIVQDTGSSTSLALQKSTNGGTSFTTITDFQSNTAGFHQPFTHVEQHTGSTGSVEYRIVVKTTSANPSVTYETDEISFTVVEYKVGEFGSVNDLSDATITSASTGQYLKYNGAQWVNTTPTILDNSDVTGSPSADNLLKWNGSAWAPADAGVIAGLITINQLSDVDTSGVATNSILKYNGSNWVVATDIDTTTDVVDDTTPQLGGDLDVNGKNITGSAVSITTSSAGNITLNPDGAGEVRILGDLTVTGSATTMDVTNMTVEDPIMLLNKHGSQPANNATDAGVMIQRGTAENNAAWFWEEGTDRWVAATTVSNASATDITVTANADIQAGTAHLTATAAQYADLAEIYESDADYEPGTVLVIGGDKEVTQCKMLQDPRVVGVVSTNPAYLMNKDANGVAVALRGKVPCKVEGAVKKGDVLVSNVKPGTATALAPESANPPAWCIIGKSLENSTDTGIKVINIVV